ncbi:hypothetical protein ACA910_012863 [Epithemia clementina (nom. ined.)]
MGHGSYHAYLKNRWGQIVEVRPDFGRRPNQAAVWMDNEDEMRYNAKPLFWPFEDYSDLLSMLYYKVERDPGL